MPELGMERLRAPGTRDRVIGVRVDRNTVKALDLLIEAGTFETRSAAAAWLIHAGIDAQGDLFERIATTVSQIRDLKVRAQTITRELTDRQGETSEKA